MKNMRIEDLSEIKERREGEEDLGETKKRSHIHCPERQNGIYQCPICSRLRAVCPFSRMAGCQNDRTLLNPLQNVSQQSKTNNSTMFGERLKTYSTMESRMYNKNPVNFTHNSISQGTNVTSVGNQSEGRLVRNPQTQEIIFYPVVHNKIVRTVAQKRTPPSTPTRRNKNERWVDIQEDLILTPTQFKSMMQSYR